MKVKTLKELTDADMGKHATVVNSTYRDAQWEGILSTWGGCYGLEPQAEFGWMPILPTDEVTIHE